MEVPIVAGSPIRRRVTASKNTTPPWLSPTTSVRPSGARAMAISAVALATHDADRGRAAQQRGEQVAARARRVVERDALAREQQRAVEVVLGRAPARRAAAPSAARASVARRAALVERDERRRATATHEQRGDAGERAGAGAAARARARGPAGVEERALGRVELVLVAGAPVERGGQPRAAVELAGVAPALVPLARGVARGGGAGGGPRRPPRASRAGAATRAAAPRARPRPSPSLTVSRRRSVSTSSDRGDVRSPCAVELGERDAPAHDRAALALAGEAQQDRARDAPAARGRARPYAVLGQPRDRAAHAAACARRRRGAGGARRARCHSSSSAVESSGSAPGSSSTSASSASTSSGSTLQPGALRGQLDRAAQLVARIGPTSTWLAPSSRDSSG